METIKVKDLMLQTGLTYRQIDYWCRRGIIDPVNGEDLGSGFDREFDASTTESIRVLGIIAKACKNRLTAEILREIYDNFNAGHIYLAPGIKLEWGDKIIEEAVRHTYFVDMSDPDWFKRIKEADDRS